MAMKMIAFAVEPESFAAAVVELDVLLIEIVELKRQIRAVVGPGLKLVTKINEKIIEIIQTFQSTYQSVQNYSNMKVVEW